MKMNKYLIISNNLFSHNNANGKYLKNYLSFLNTEEIYNFYISGENKTDIDTFKSFCITDSLALKMFKTLGLYKNKNEENKSENTTKNNNSSQSSLKHILRFCVWNSGFWKKSGINKWIIEQNPKTIITLISNNPYLMKIAYKTSRKLNVPLFTFVCEDYPLKEYDYLAKCTKPSFFYKIFHRLTYKYAKKVLENSKSVIFNTPEIKDLYTSKIKINKSLICYPPSNINKNNISMDNINNFLYAGNLGLGRLETLIELAKSLKELKYAQKIDLYGKVTDEQIEKIKTIDNIVYHGLVTNDELMQLYSKAGILLHVEFNDEYNKLDLKYAFSTKLADMICSGKRIMLYAPKGLCETEYFIKNLPNNVAISKEELPEVLKYVTSPNYDFNVQTLVAKNHNIEESNKIIEREIRKL